MNFGGPPRSVLRVSVFSPVFFACASSNDVIAKVEKRVCQVSSSVGQWFRCWRWGGSKRICKHQHGIRTAVGASVLGHRTRSTAADAPLHPHRCIDPCSTEVDDRMCPPDPKGKACPSTWMCFWCTEQDRVAMKDRSILHAPK